MQQMYFIGWKSVFVIALTGLFTGMVLGFQGFYALQKAGMTAILGAAVALSLIRELGPVLTAIMVTSRAGSAMAAEIGVMRISEQIDALDTMDIDPIRFLVAPRLIAGIICVPLLTALFDTIGIVGGYITGVKLLGVQPGTFVAQMEATVKMNDITDGFIKSFVFALIVITICTYKGYSTHLQRRGYGARGVGMSTTTAVVLSCVLILVVDYVLTSFLIRGNI